METPHFPSSIFAEYFESVYEPAEDTFILLDALETDLLFIKDIDPLVCLEIGCGSGAVITSLAKSLGPHKRLYFATDINRRALDCTRKCIQINLKSDDEANESELVQLIQTNLTSSFEPKLDASIDLLIFNPPYVPTPDEEIQNGIVASWAGGIDGRRIIDTFLRETLCRTLSPSGVAYLVVIEPNNLDEMNELSTKLGFTSKRIITRKCGIEKLSVLRFQRL